MGLSFSSLACHTPVSCWFRAKAALVLLAIAVLFSGGCGQEGKPPASTVDGMVTFQGKPVTGGILTFHIKDVNGVELPFAGELDVEGNYELTNAVPGSAVITVDTATEEGLSNYFPLPRKFADPAKSGLTLEITLGHQEHDIALE